jgi:D-alanine-D-alanine ligase
MRIGITCDLKDDYKALGLDEEAVAELDSIETIEAIETALASLGHVTDRIGHIRRLVERLARGERWDLVFNLCEGLAGRSREAQVPALLEAYNIPYTFSDPLVMAATLDKAVAKRIVRDHGLATAPFAVVDRAADAERIDLPLPLFVKPVAEGTGKGVSPRSWISDRRDLAPRVVELLAGFRQPVLVESYLPGREFTVGILGCGDEAWVVGTMEILLLPTAEPGAYTYVNKELYEDRVRYRLVDDQEARATADLALASYRALECADAGRVDLRSDARGRPHFLEVNPLPGLNPQRSDLPILAGMVGMSHGALIGAIVDSAIGRQDLDRQALPRQAA